jgi:hypothetical protein
VGCHDTLHPRLSRVECRRFDTPDRPRRGASAARNGRGPRHLSRQAVPQLGLARRGFVPQAGDAPHRHGDLAEASLRRSSSRTAAEGGLCSPRKRGESRQQLASYAIALPLRGRDELRSSRGREWGVSRADSELPPSPSLPRTGGVRRRCASKDLALRQCKRPRRERHCAIGKLSDEHGRGSNYSGRVASAARGRRCLLFFEARSAAAAGSQCAATEHRAGFRTDVLDDERAGKENLIKRWMDRTGCDRTEAMRLVTEEWRRDNRRGPRREPEATSSVTLGIERRGSRSLRFMQPRT